MLNRPFSLLFISSDKYPPFRVDVNVLFAEELSSRGHDIDWILQSESDCSRSYIGELGNGRVFVGANCNGESRLGRLKKHFQSLKNDLVMFSQVRQQKYDFLQVKDKFLSALLGLFAARIGGAKFIYWLSYPFPEESLLMAKSGIARYPGFYWIRGIVFKFLLYRVIMPLSDHVFVQSEQMKKDVAAMGVDAMKLTSVPMGIKLDSIPGTCIPNAKTENGVKKIVYLGTLIRVRRIDFLIRVFAQVVKEIPHAILYLVGGGDDQEDIDILKSAIVKEGLQDSIILTGFLPMEKAWNYVLDADVCVSPFYPTPILNSTSPTKLIEYMAIGKPVVANDHPEQKLVLSESHGGICCPYDEFEFSSAIIELLNDTELARHMGKSGRNYVLENRVYSKIADNVEKQYRKMM